MDPLTDATIVADKDGLTQSIVENTSKIFASRVSARDTTASATWLVKLDTSPEATSWWQAPESAQVDKPAEKSMESVNP